MAKVKLSKAKTAIIIIAAIIFALLVAGGIYCVATDQSPAIAIEAATAHQDKLVGKWQSQKSPVCPRCRCGSLPPDRRLAAAPGRTSVGERYTARRSPWDRGFYGRKRRSGRRPGFWRRREPSESPAPRQCGKLRRGRAGGSAAPSAEWA